MKNEKSPMLILAYLIMTLILAIILAPFIYLDFIVFSRITTNPTIKILILVFLAGIIGGCVYLLRSFYKHFSAEKNFDLSWTPWYFIRPILSGVGGVFVYFLLKVGLITLGSLSISTEPRLVTALVVSFFAGFSFHEAMNKFHEISKKLFKTGVDNNDT